MTMVRAVAFYLPQYHPIPENDLWWGQGFTEWTNVAKAKPLFPGHYQPRIPADLGFYDLRVPETREAQADMARQYGIEGFCYWHYWFAGKRLLERPFNEVLHSGKPDFPFCLGWANETWSGIWHGAPHRILIEQSYPGMEDHEAHFNYMLQAFRDPRYLTVSGKPILVIYKPLKLPDARKVTDLWRDLAIRSGLPGLYIVGVLSGDRLVNLSKYGLDAVTFSNQGAIMGATKNSISALYKKMRQYLHKKRPLHIYQFEQAMHFFLEKVPQGTPYHPTVIPDWDNTARSGSRGLILHGSSPELFRKHLREAIDYVLPNPPETRLVFVKSWNEWAEGNYLEPDLRYGRAYLEVLRDEISASDLNATSFR